MLVLNRKEDERVMLIDEATGKVLATVMLVATRGNQARLGFQVPRGVRIVREELLRREEDAA